MPHSAEIKIAYIGGGSRDWAHKLMADLSLCPYLCGRLSLYDIDYNAAAHNAAIAQAIFSRSSTAGHFTAQAVHRVADALRGADFVVLSIEPGPTRLRYADLEIPRKYGILQTVGDTTGPGGVLRALRSVPIKMDYAHKIMKYCPKAWVINYTNPMTLCTAALYAAEPHIKAFGCCHEVFGTQEYIAQLVSKWFDVPVPARHEIALDVSGVNHFTMATSAVWRGKDLMPRLQSMAENPRMYRDRSRAAVRRAEKSQWFTSDSLIKFDLLRNFRVFGAAGDRHLMEFVPWYLKSEKEIHRWGVIRTPFSWRIKRARAARRSPGDFVQMNIRHSSEEGVEQMMALCGIKPLTTNINMPNTGQMPGAPAGAVVETMARLTKDSIAPIAARPLPAPAFELQRRIINEQDMVLKAASTKNEDLALAALLTDPLVSIPTCAARKMLDEMIYYTREALPGW